MLGRNRKREGGAWAIVRLCPQPAVMSIDDGAADVQAYTHSVAFGGVEGVKQLVHALGLEPAAGISDGHAHAITGLPGALDEQVPRPVVHVGHRVDGVTKQVENDLLQLDPVAGNGRKISGEFRLQRDAVALELAQRQRDDLSRRVVQIERLDRECFLLNIARSRVVTSAARFPSRIIRLAVSRAPATSGGSASSIRRQVPALVMMPDSG